MAVIFVPRNRHSISVGDILGFLGQNLIAGMFERDKAARQYKYDKRAADDARARKDAETAKYIEAARASENPGIAQNADILGNMLAAAGPAGLKEFTPYMLARNNTLDLGDTKTDAFYDPITGHRLGSSEYTVGLSPEDEKKYSVMTNIADADRASREKIAAGDLGLKRDIADKKHLIDMWKLSGIDAQNETGQDERGRFTEYLKALAGLNEAIPLTDGNGMEIPGNRELWEKGKKRLDAVYGYGEPEPLPQLPPDNGAGAGTPMPEPDAPTAGEAGGKNPARGLIPFLSQYVDPEFAKDVMNNKKLSSEEKKLMIQRNGAMNFNKELMLLINKR